MSDVSKELLGNQCRSSGPLVLNWFYCYWSLPAPKTPLSTLLAACARYSGRVDAPAVPPLVVGLPALLLQPRDDGRGAAGLAQPHLDEASPGDGPASPRLPAALHVGQRDLTLPFCVLQAVSRVGELANGSFSLCLSSELHPGVSQLALVEEEGGRVGPLP